MPRTQLGRLFEVFAVILEAYEERRAERMKRMASEVSAAQYLAPVLWEVLSALCDSAW